MAALHRLLRTVMTLCFALAVAAVPTSQVAACRCVAGAPAAMAANADAAFSGTVVDLQHPPVDPGTADQVIATFAVDSVAHGVLGDRVPVIAFVGEASCGMEFALEERWLIIADRDGAMLRTGLCDGGSRLDIGQAPPLAMQPVSPSGVAEPVAVIPLVVGAAAVLLVLASLLAFRRART